MSDISECHVDCLKTGYGGRQTHPKHVDFCWTVHVDQLGVLPTFQHYMKKIERHGKCIVWTGVVFIHTICSHPTATEAEIKRCENI